MQPGLSTHVFLQQHLDAGLLDTMMHSGAQSIEIFAARHHFDYTDRSVVREIGKWFRSNEIAATLHQPLYSDAQWSRHVAPTFNIIDIEKWRRIEALDEVKRAVEAAEQIPFTAVILHLGTRENCWDTRALDHSITAIEHLKAFAHPLGVKVLLENLHNEVATPEHLLEIMRSGHFSTVGICFDIGHAHLSDTGIEASFALTKSRIGALHLHDNHGARDEHLWLGSGDIDWVKASTLMAELPNGVPATIEITHELGVPSESVATKARSSFDLLKRQAESASLGAASEMV